MSRTPGENDQDDLDERELNGVDEAGLFGEDDEDGGSAYERLYFAVAPKLISFSVQKVSEASNASFLTRSSTREMMRTGTIGLKMRQQRS